MDTSGWKGLFLPPQCLDGVQLHQGVVGAIEHCRGLAKGINLASTRFLAHVVVLDQEVALRVQRVNVLVGCCKLLGGRCKTSGLIFQSCLQISKRASLSVRVLESSARLSAES